MSALGISYGWLSDVLRDARYAVRSWTRQRSLLRAFAQSSMTGWRPASIQRASLGRNGSRATISAVASTARSGIGIAYQPSSLARSVNEMVSSAARL